MVMLITRSMWLLMYAYVVIILPQVLGQSPTQCADVDEYCLTHSDCCSKTCLTYLYRCTRRYNGINPYTLFGEKNPVPGTLQDVVGFTFSNFASVEEMQKHQQQQHQHQHNNPVQHTPHGFHGRFSDEGIGEAQYVNDEAVEDKTTAATTSAPSKVDTIEEAQQKATNSTVENREDASDAVAASCKEIGEKCYTHDECCTKRCHGFLHQCVT